MLAPSRAPRARIPTPSPDPPMIFADALLALFLAIVLLLVFSLCLGLRSPWSAPWTLFWVLFLFIWAGGAWATPVGPMLYDVDWLPLVLFGLLLMLFVAASARSLPGRAFRSSRPRRECRNRARPRSRPSSGC